MIAFKPLEAEDIEVRVQAVSKEGCSLLLYKDARCDMRLLDEAVGPENWDCSYQSINGNLFCTVGVRCGDEWVYKQDVGTKSNMEPDKGEASDAFKRACFKWGLGRELYTAPSIWVGKGALKKHEYDQSRGKWTCRDRFKVKSVTVEDGRIADLEIANGYGETVYRMRQDGRSSKGRGNMPPKDVNGPQNANGGRYAALRALKAEAVSLGVKEEGIEAWIAATFKGKPKKDFTDTEIRIAETYLTGLIRDKKELADG